MLFLIEIKKIIACSNQKKFKFHLILSIVEHYIGVSKNDAKLFNY
jgi:DNA-directed RNA polymerase delta subunit